MSPGPAGGKGGKGLCFLCSLFRADPCAPLAQVELDRMSAPCPVSGWGGLQGMLLSVGTAAEATHLSCPGPLSLWLHPPPPSLPDESSQALLILQLMQLGKCPGQCPQQYLEHHFQLHCLPGADWAAGGHREMLSLAWGCGTSPARSRQSPAGLFELWGTGTRQKSTQGPISPTPLLLDWGPRCFPCSPTQPWPWELCPTESCPTAKGPQRQVLQWDTPS